MTTLSSREFTVGEIMQAEVVTILEDQNMHDASVLMANNNLGFLPVIKKDGTLVGTITDHDIVTRCNILKKDICKMSAKECMTKNPYKLVSSMLCSDAIHFMSICGVRRLLVVRNDKLVGIISSSDIAKICDFCPNEKCPMEDCILIDMAKCFQRTSHLSFSA